MKISFYASKSITCGECGAIITNHTKYIDKIRSVSNNCMSKPAFKRFENNKFIYGDSILVGSNNITSNAR